MITGPIQTRRALPIWQRPLGQQGDFPRWRFAVAELVKEDERLGFAYNDDLDSAFEAGFKGYPGLPLALGHECSRATDVLKRRLPPQNRLDFNEFKERLWSVTEWQFHRTETVDSYRRPPQQRQFRHLRNFRRV